MSVNPALARMFGYRLSGCDDRLRNRFIASGRRTLIPRSKRGVQRTLDATGGVEDFELWRNQVAEDVDAIRATIVNARVVEVTPLDVILFYEGTQEAIMRRKQAEMSELKASNGPGPTTIIEFLPDATFVVDKVEKTESWPGTGRSRR